MRTAVKRKTKTNPGPADLAAIASTVLSSMEIMDRVSRSKRKVVRRKKRTTRRNPETKAQVAARMAKVRAAKKNPKAAKAAAVKRTTAKANPPKSSRVKSAAVKPTLRKANPRKQVRVPAKGDFYLLTIGTGDDVMAVYLQDGDKDGFSKRFKSIAAAKAYATKNRLALKNPAKPIAIAAPKAAAKRKPNPVKRKRNAAKKPVVARKIANPKSVPRAVATGAVRRTAANPPQKFAVGDRVKDIYTGKVSTVSKSYWQNYAGGNTSDYTVEFKEGGWNKSSNLKKVARRRKANPTGKVPRRRTFEMFNGRPATKTKTVEISPLIGRNARVDQLGRLVEIHLESGERLKLNPAKFSLVAKNGRLWIAGGKFHAGPTPTRKINPWSRIKNIVYQTHKPHHGDPKGQHYIHEMGEWSGNRPMLSIDNKGYPVIQGGSYKIEARGIVD